MMRETRGHLATARSVRSTIRAFPLRPFDDLDASPKLASDHLFNRAQHLIDQGWERWNHAIPSIKAPVPWRGERGSFDYSLNAWEPLTWILPSYSYTGEQRYFDAALEFAWDWHSQVQAPLLEDRDAAIAKLTSEPMTALWYDMAVGQRIYRLAYIADVVARDTRYSDEMVAALFASLDFHHHLLAVEKFFAANSNHGVYQALGQLAAARRFDYLPEHAAWRDFASERVSRLLDLHFTESGVHKEHSPSYHYMLLGSFSGAKSSGVIAQPDLAERIARMEGALAWMIKPDCHLVEFGDSDPRPMRQNEAMTQRLTDQGLRYALTEGRAGHASPSGVRAYLDAGYAFARLYAPDVAQAPPNASYLAQQAGFHSRVHKHADHLSFVWYDRHRDILIDPARYAYAGKTPVGSELHAEGFWYSDPKRIYCETTRAHNCVEIDGRSYQRNRVKPFGSALLAATEQDGLAVTDCEMTVFKSVRHRRHLIMAPGHFLLVLDWLYDRSGEAHDYRQWFHFDNPWDVRADGAVIRARHAGGNGVAPLDVSAASLLDGPSLGPVVRGQEEPLLGWQSDKPYSLIPSSCFDLHLRSSEPTIFATLFTLSPELVIEPGASRFNATMKVGRAAWRDHLGAHQIDIARGEDDTLTVKRTTRLVRNAASASGGADALPRIRG